MKAGSVRLGHFEIQTETAEDKTRALYTNGRHQCKLVVLIAKNVADESGNWQFAALTAAERNSLTVTQYATNPDAPLPTGWHCDTDKDKYDPGLWPPRGSETNSTTLSSSPAKPSIASGPLEMVERYMRVNAGQPIQSYRFMARIQIAGKVYTTNYTDDDASFNSWVEIQPERPYVLRVAQLVRYIDNRAFEDKARNIYIDVHYWTPPRGLQFIQNVGIANPLNIKDEGRFFNTSDFISVPNDKSGILVERDSLEERVFMADVQQGIYSGNGPDIEYRRCFKVMRALKLHGGVPATPHRDTGHWSLLDNFGCEHKFRLKLGGTPSLELTD